MNKNKNKNKNLSQALLAALFAALLAPVTALGLFATPADALAQYATALPANPSANGPVVVNPALANPAGGPPAPLYLPAAPQVVYSAGMAAPSAYPHPAYSTVAYPQTAYPQTPFPQTTFPQTAYPQTAYPQTANPQPAYLQPVNPQVASAGATVTPLYTPVTLFNWWRPRTVAGYMVTPNASTVVARPAYTAVAPANMAGSAGPAGPAMVAPVAVPVAPAPVTAYYQPSYHPGGIVVATPPAPTAMAPITVHPPAYGDATVVAPAPVVYARPVVGPRQAYLYSRGPLGFPRLDPVPPGTVVQPAAVPFIPAILP